MLYREHSNSDGHLPKTLLLSHGFMRDSQSVLWLWLTVSGSYCTASLAQWRVLLGQTQDPPSGPTTRSKAPRSQSLFVLVRGTQSCSQRNPSLKWNISTGAFVALSDTNILSSINNSSLYTIIWSLIPLVISQYLSVLLFFPCFVSLRSVNPLPPFPPFRPYFSFTFSDRLAPHPCFIVLWAHSCCESGQCSENGPLIYSVLDYSATIVRDYSDLLRQAHKNRSLHLNIAPNVGFVRVCVVESERERKQFSARANPTKEWNKIRVTSTTHRAVKLANGTMSSLTLCS